jgi:hypothetical protein
MTKNGKLSKRDMETLNKAWEILSDYTQVREDREDYTELCEDDLFTNAMTAVAGLCEFIGNYEEA